MAELFADLLGQPRAVALLEAALERRRIAPAYLFAGADGVGRRLAALRFLEGVVAGPESWRTGLPILRRRLAQGNHPDLLWVEPTYQHQGRLVKASEALAEGVNRRSAPQIRLEQIRELTRFLARHPVEAPGGLVVLEGAEAMAEGAANALLKTLEEPGTGMLILICAAPDQLLSTIRSRCQQIPFVRLSSQLVGQVLAGLPAVAPPVAVAVAETALLKKLHRRKPLAKKRWVSQRPPLQPASWLLPKPCLPSQRRPWPQPEPIPPNYWSWRRALPEPCWSIAVTGGSCLRAWPSGCWPWIVIRSRPWAWRGISVRP
jgi:DNA polymerase-3 subunit delta'